MYHPIKQTEMGSLMASGTVISEAGPMDEARRFVLLALRGAIGLGDGASSSAALEGELSEAEVKFAVDFIKRSKVGGLVWNGAKRVKLPIAPALKKVLEAERQIAIIRNMQNLIETAKVSELMTDAGIKYAVMKGPVRSFEVFAALDTRPSVDIDILVSRADYARTGELLCANGYARGVPINDRWWNEHLGESPYRPTHSHCIVDVHHKVQQPGGPGPQGIDEFINDRRDIALAGRTYHVLGRAHALVLTYISVSKAMRNGEVWIGQATEIATVRKNASQGDQAQFDALAKRHGLGQMISQIDAVIACLFAVPPRLAGFGGGVSRIEDLAAGAFGTADRQHGYLHRSRLLWQWTAGEGFVKAARFLWLTGERMISDARRPRTHKTPRSVNDSTSIS